MDTERVLARNRLGILKQIEDWLETPMIVLGFVWLVLLVVEFTRGLPPPLQTAGTVIWGLFVLDFLLRFTLAPRKLRYLRRNVLTAISLMLPALRAFRIVRLFRVARGVRLVRVLASLNRGLRITRASLARRGFGYVVALTLVVVAVGAAGMHAFERDAADGRGFETYGDALWWTAMIITTLGSEFWPRTAEGRLLALVLALYGFAVFGYVTATLAALFIDRDAEDPRAQVAGAKSVAALHAEIRALRAELREAGPGRLTRA